MTVSKTVVGSSILSAPANYQRSLFNNSYLTRIKMSKFGNYVKSSYDELVHKVSWPSFKELQSSSVVVAVAAIILALIVFAMDVVFGVQSMGWKGILGYFYSLIG